MSYEQTRYVLKLEIPLIVDMINDKEEYNELNGITDKCMNKIDNLSYSEWSEGRYPFYREMFGLALSHILKDVAFSSLRQIIGDKIGHDHMTEIENGKYNTAYDIAGRIVSKVCITPEQDGWKAAVEEIKKASND